MYYVSYKSKASKFWQLVCKLISIRLISFNDFMKIEEKKEAIWLSPMKKCPIPTEKSKKHHDNMKTPPRTSIAQRLRTDLGRSVGVTAVNPTGVVKRVYERSTFPLAAKEV